MSLFKKKKQDSENPKETAEPIQPKSLKEIENALRKEKLQGIAILSDKQGACYFMGGQVKGIIVEICTAMEMDENFALIIRSSLELFDSFKEDKNAKSNTEDASRSGQE